MFRRFAWVLSPFVLLLTYLLFTGCGSGSGGGGTAPPPDFSVSMSPASLTVLAGASTTFQITAQALNGFNGSINVVVNGGPVGITTTPSLPITITPASSQTITVTCASSVVVGSYPLQLTATAGTLKHTQNATLLVVVPDYTMGVSPASLPLDAGGQASFQVSLQPVYGFNGTVQVKIDGVPREATVTPGTTFPLDVSAPQTITVAASPRLASASYPLTITGTYGSRVTSTTETLKVQNLSPPTGRAGFVETDDAPGGGAYDRKHQRVYVSNPVAGTVDVISSTSYEILRRIPVPQPAGIDISPDESTVFVGTGSVAFPGIGPAAVFALDTATMTLAARYDGPSAGALGIWYPESPLNPIAAPDGTALISVNGSIVKWNPSTGQKTTLTTGSTLDLSVTSPFSNSPIMVAAHSRDHSRLILSSNTYPSDVWLYDLSQNAILTKASFDGFAYSVAASPDGTQFAVAVVGYVQNIYILDANLQTTAVLPGGGSLVYSFDGSKLYTVGVIGSVPAVSILDTATHRWIGSAPSFTRVVPGQVPPLEYESPMAVDETGRIFGRSSKGLAVDDTTDLRNYNGTEQVYTHLFEVAPNNSFVGQTQKVQILTDWVTPPPSIWFGSQPAQNTDSGPPITTTAPASGKTGPVHVLLETAEGVQTWIPQGYTYGALLPPGPDIAASSDGGTTLHIFGLGLGYAPAIGSTPTGPPTTVTFGSKSVTAASVDGIYDNAVWDVSVLTPQMPSGAADLKASYPATGSSTLRAAYHAVSVHSQALDGTPYGLAYDSGRNQVYVAVADHVDVFSLSANTFVSTIQIPTVNKLKQLAGMALTPDGKFLIVANWADGSVAVIDPDHPSGATAIAIAAPPGPASGLTLGPYQIAPTNNGQAYISLSAAPQSLTTYAVRAKRDARMAARPSAAPALASATWLLNLSTMTVAPVPPINYIPGGYYMAASPDGSVICSANPPNGPMTVFHVAGSSIDPGPVSGQQSADFCAVNGGIVVSANQNRIGAPIVSDLSARVITYAGMIDYQYLNLIRAGLDSVQGIAADATGALMYVPWSSDIALFDTHTGEYRERIALAQTLVELSTGSLLIDKTGQQIFVVTSGGLTVIQLDTLPLAIGSISVSGGTWTIAGTGFVQGTSVSIDGVSHSVAYIDAQHLTISGAPGLGGIHTVTLANPDGHTYTYDGAYLR